MRGTFKDLDQLFDAPPADNDQAAENAKGRYRHMDHTYEAGWHRYGFDNMEFVERAIHGADVPITLKLAINRGLFKPHISFAVIEPTETEQTIGMHIHRDLPTNIDVEEWYIIIDGKAVMTFSNGDTVDVGKGDMIATYPGTGHSFRAVETVHLISITPQMFTSRSPAEAAPEKFSPRIYVSDVNDSMNALRAECTVCGAVWNRPDDDKGSNTLPVWARHHAGDHTEDPAAGLVGGSTRLTADVRAADGR